MIGATLVDIRHHVESLASETGSYYLRCGRTGERPVPATGLYFEDRPVARAAARATEQYRAALRQYDPQLPDYDVIACQRPTVGATADGHPAADGPPPRASESRPTDGDSRVDFCHRIAGALFETVADSSHDGVEDAIMDTYFRTAESIESADELCLRLLESIATELEERLDSGEQLEILRATADRLPPRPITHDPLEATLSRLRSCTLLEEYALEPATVEFGAASRVMTVRGYALRRPGTRVVTLPVVVELLRRWPGRELSVDWRRLDAEHRGACQLAVTARRTDGSNGLLTVSEVSTS
ncbi:DUF7551 domain-containing protein [Natronorubrum sp. DTA7]|uniref:DUF7551 domain-containing protein n=1 Tax=Natronorubrum sp. DTA7 TaxID=3447016 RepID=UPI003F87E77A